MSQVLQSLEILLKKLVTGGFRVSYINHNLNMQLIYNSQTIAILMSIFMEDAMFGICCISVFQRFSLLCVELFIYYISGVMTSAIINICVVLEWMLNRTSIISFPLGSTRIVNQ